MLTRTSAPTSNPSPSPVVIKTIPFFPCQGEFADLKANGQILDQSTLLNIADKITALNAQTSREGDKYSKKDLPALIGINSPFSIFCKGEQYFTSYVKLGDSGSVGTVRLAQNHVTKKWHVFKSVHFKTEDKIEEKNRKEVKAKNDFNVLQQTQTVPGNIGINVSKKGSIKWNYFFDYVPGIDLFKLTEILANNEQILPDVLMLHIAHQLVIALKTLHAHPRFPIFHCDLKRENVVCDLSSKSLAFVDFDSSLPYKPEGHVLTAPRGNYLHGDSRFKSFHQQKCHSLLQGKHFEGSFQYDLNSEIHGLGIMLADLFLLFDPPTFDSTKHESVEQLVTLLNPNDSYIVNQSHPYYLKNPLLNDLNIKTKVLNYLHRMTSEKNMSLDEIEKFFAECKQECILSPHCKKMQVVMLDVNKYLSSYGITKFYFNTELHQASEVWFVDNHDRGELFYMQLRHTLQKEGIIAVGQQVYISSNFEEACRKIREDLDKGDLKGGYEFSALNQFNSQITSTPVIRL